MRKLILNSVISVITVILIFLLLELFARFLNPILRIPHGHISLGIGGHEVLEYPSGYIKDRELFWRLEPSFGEYNSKGFRDREFPFQKENNTFRIICMGDSVTFGWPSKLEHTYPKELEKLLSLQFPEKKFEVLNAGVPGYTSYQGLKWLQKDIVQYQPDLIIVYYGINDRSGVENGYESDKYQKTLSLWLVRTANCLRKFEFYKLFNKILLNFKYPLREKVSYSAHRVSFEDYKNNLENMMELAKNNGIKTLFIINPVFYDPQRRIVFTDAKYFPPENVLQFDIYSIFKKRENEASEFFVDDVRPNNFHLTGNGHKTLAEEVFNFLVKNNILE